jgi:site-specific DNA recombinase
MNEKYALDASLYTRRDRRGNARNGYWNGGPVPFGYCSRTVVIDGKKERKKLFVVEEEAAVVRLIFGLAQHGVGGQPMGTRSIAAYLNDNGYALRGRPFFHGNLDGILRREHYTGSYCDRTADDQGNRPSESEAITVECPKIIDPSIMLAVAARRAKAAPRVTAPRLTNGPTLLTTVAKCGGHRCGSGMTIRTGKGGRYSYYTCNARATAGALKCSTKAIPQGELDAIVTGTLLERVLQPDRLKVLLHHVLERSDVATERRKNDLDRIRSARIEAEKRLRNLYGLVEEGLESPRDAHFAARLADRKKEVAQLETRERSLLAQLNTTKRSIDAETVERFGEVLADRVRNGEPALRRAWIQLFVKKVTISNDEIIISGSKSALEAALVHGSKRGTLVVPSFDLEWCPEEDSNLHDLAIAST